MRQLFIFTTLNEIITKIEFFHQGIQLVGELISYYGLDVVQAYMRHMQNNAEVAVRNMLKDIAKQTKERFIDNFIKFNIS